MKTLKTSASGIVLCLFELIVGILLMINPVGFTSSIIMLAGAMLTISGFISIIRYFKADMKEAAASQNLMKGLATVLVGCFCFIKSNWFIATFPMLTIIYGVMILFNALAKIQTTVDMLRAKSKYWFWPAINAVLSISCAMVILKTTFTSTAVLWIFTGISMIAEAILDAITLIAGYRERRHEK